MRYGLGGPRASGGLGKYDVPAGTKGEIEDD
jgi:hypothetical protein